MMTDEEIIARIQWNRTAAPHARKGPKITISGNVPPLKPGDKPVGEAVTFKYNCPERYIRAAFRKVQRDIVASYRKHNEGDPVQQTEVPDLAQQLTEAWSPN